MAVGDQGAAGSTISRRRLIAGAGGLTLALAAGGELLAYVLRDEIPQCRAPWIRGRSEDRGLAAAFSRRGSGPPLLLLHGAGSSARTWESVADLLEERYDLLIPDLPGFGQSPMLSGRTPDAANLTDALAHWLQTIGVEQPHVAGVSLGGALALELGFRGAARSVTALSPVGFSNYAEYLYLRCALAAGYGLVQVVPSLTLTMAQGTTLRPLFFGLFFTRSEHIDGPEARCVVEDLRHAQGLLETIDAFKSYRIQQRDVGVPVTIAWGANDRLLVGPQDQRAKRMLPAATHLLLPDCGHLFFADDAELIASIIDRTASATISRDNPKSRAR